MKLIYSIHKYDISIFTWLFNVRIHATLVGICRHISRTGDGQLYALLLVMLLLTVDYQSTLFQAIILGFCIERPVYFVLKNGFKRNRPEAALKDFDGLITPSDKFSFPSGQTSAAFMMASLIGYFFPLLAGCSLCLGCPGRFFARCARGSFSYSHIGRHYFWC